jgi:hypothetical protein
VRHSLVASSKDSAKAAEPGSHGMRVVSQSPDPLGKMHTMNQKIAASRNGFWPKSIFLGVCGSGGNRLSRQPGREADLVQRIWAGPMDSTWGMGWVSRVVRCAASLGSAPVSEPGLFARSLRRELGAPASMATRSPMPKLSCFIDAISIPEASR